MTHPRTRNSVMAAGLAVSLISIGAASSMALAGEPLLKSELVVNGLSSPLFITHAPGDADRLFVIERAGRIRVIEQGSLLATPFLDIDPLVSTNFEGGLLGLAFHPEYETNGYFYVNYTRTGEGGFSLITVVARYEVTTDPNLADPRSARLILEVGQPASNHNAGWIGFSPLDDMLYVPLGDGGFSGNGPERAQDITDQLLGKMLRLDVDGDDFPRDPDRNYTIPPDNPFVGKKGDDEIWALGLRNPWRCAFDRETGDLWIGDVGAGSREEVDFMSGQSAGAENFGWGCMEGSLCQGGFCTCNSPSLTLPVHEYSHAVGNAITGGVVYRGCAIPDLQGAYFFADFGSARIWTLRYVNGQMTSLTERTAELDPPGAANLSAITCFGEDSDGELYVCDIGGAVYRILPVEAPSDKNGNGIADWCEKPNSPGDLDEDGDVDSADLAILLGAWGLCPPDCAADLNRDGSVDPADLAILLGNWG